MLLNQSYVTVVHRAVAVGVAGYRGGNKGDVLNHRTIDGDEMLGGLVARLADTQGVDTGRDITENAFDDFDVPVTDEERKIVIDAANAAFA